MKAWRSAVSGLVLCSVFGFSAFACSGDDDDSKSNGTGGKSGSGGADASSGGSGGSATGGTSSGGSGGSATGGNAGAATGGSSGAASGGSAGAAGQPGDAGADACDYLDLDIFLVDCNAQHLYLRRWTSLANDPNCPDFWTLEGQSQQFATQAAALQSSNCNANCVRHPATSVSLLKCGFKTGYIVYHGDNCPDVLETPDGFFSSVEEWNEAFPCADQ